MASSCNCEKNDFQVFPLGFSRNFRVIHQKKFVFLKKISLVNKNKSENWEICISCVLVKTLNLIRFTKYVNLMNLVYFSDTLVAVRHLTQRLYVLQIIFFHRFTNSMLRAFLRWTQEEDFSRILSKSRVFQNYFTRYSQIFLLAEWTVLQL